jgi:RNA polymerase sigma-70 factor (ECF subfamily)
MDRLQEFEENLRVNQNALINIISSKIKNKSDAFDIFQKASITMWRKYDSFDKNTVFMAWASTIASYETKNYIRSFNRCPVKFDSETYDVVSMFLLSSSNEDNNDTLSKLNSAITKLDDISRRLVISVYIDGEEIKNLAKRDGKSPQTYYNKLNLAKKNLIEFLS